MARTVLMVLAFAAGEVLLFWLARLLYKRFSGPGAPLFLGRYLGDSPLLPWILLGLYALSAALGVFGLFQALDSGRVEDVLAGSPAGGTPLAQASSGTEVPTIQATAAQPGESAGQPGGKIVYVCQIFKDRDRDQICMLSPAGGGIRRLSANDDGDYNFPSLAPDGKSLVYVAKESQDSVFEVYEMDFDGNVRQLTQGEGDNGAPVISPDGKSIAFYRVLEGQANSIWVMDRDGGSAHQVFGPPEGQGWNPVWSPDGSLILFSSDRTGTVQLYTIRPDGSDLARVTNIERLNGRSDWSPDGAALASSVGEDWEHEIVVMNPDGSLSRTW